MLFEFLNFLGINNKTQKQNNNEINKNIEKTEIIEHEQIYKIEEKETINKDNKKIKKIIETIPIGNGKAIRKVQIKNIDRI